MILISVGKVVEKLEDNMVQPLRETVWQFLEKLNMWVHIAQQLHF